jgi:ParB family chromosome partitioning protein
MARKNLLIGLTSAELPAGNSGAVDTGEPEVRAHATPHFGIGGTRGAIGAVSRSIEQLKAQAVVELAPALIDVSFISDRLQGSVEDHEGLVASIREHGQQVPILVRPHPEKEGRYQVVYGHRRLRAVSDLGKPVRAVIKPLSDEQVVIAQGQENSARTDLSFIEKALFAARLEEGGFGRETIMAALFVDKTGLSRLISAAVKIPREIIEAVGPAAKTGRDRWVELAARLDHRHSLEKALRTIAEEGFSGRGSDERFNRVFDAVAPKKPTQARPTILKADDGTRVARIKGDGQNLTVMVDEKATAGFGAYLVANLPELYAAFKRRGEA